MAVEPSEAVRPGWRETAPETPAPSHGRAPRVRHGDGTATLLLPSALLVLFLSVPLAALVYRALQSGALGSTLTGPVVWPALRLSLLTSSITLGVTIVLGTPLAYLLARSRFPGQQVVETLIDLPMVMPPVVAGVALLMAFGRKGVFGGALHASGIDLAFTTDAVILAQLFVSAPYYIRAVRAGFRSIEPELEEVAYTMGASRLQALRYVTVPLAGPALAGGAVLCWARALGEFGATMMFAGNFSGTTRTASLAIMTAFNDDLYAALALAVVLLVVAGSVLALFRLFTRDELRL